MSAELIMKFCGIAGIVASLGVVVADVLYFGRGDSYASFPLNKRALGFPFWRINSGKNLGVCLIPLVILGFVPLFYALKPSGQLVALMASGLLSYAFMIGPSGHSFVAYSSIVYRTREGLSNSSPPARALDSVLSNFKKIFMPEAFVLLITFLIGSIIYSILVLTGKTELPVWTASINPFILMAIARYSYRWAPAKIAGYLHPVCMYTGVIPLQILTLIYMWNAG